MTYDLEQAIDELIFGPNKRRVKRLYLDNRGTINTRPGSRNGHHAWKGGYKHHIEQCINHFCYLYNMWTENSHFDDVAEEEVFERSDGIVVLLLHDIEKPFMYDWDTKGNIRSRGWAKEQRKTYRDGIIEKYGIELSKQQLNALKYVEGVRDEDYVPGLRIEKPLAVLCHSADLYSARVLYNKKASY
jgi:hypothetical protein